MFKNTPHDIKETTMAEKIRITQGVITFHGVAKGWGSFLEL
jgi:hypothetical protein